MEILYMLVPLSVVLVLIVAVVFAWAAHSGQFDDLEGPARRILLDDDAAGTRAVHEGEIDVDQKAVRPGP